MRKLLFKAATKAFKSLLTSSVQADNALMTVLTLIYAVIEDVVRIFTDDERDNTAQIYDYLQEEGLQNIEDIHTIIRTQLNLRNLKNNG